MDENSSVILVLSFSDPLLHTCPAIGVPPNSCGIAQQYVALYERWRNQMETDNSNITSLDKVLGLSPELIQKLSSAWINTVEQFVAIGLTQGGLESIARQLEIDEGAARSLFVAARSILSPDAIDRLESNTEINRFGIGAMPPCPNRGESACEDDVF
jgi:hypothetical protein